MFHSLFKEKWYLYFQTEGEAIIYRDDLPVQVLDHGRAECRLLDRAKGGERIELFVEARANSAFGKFNRGTMHEPRISVFNQESLGMFLGHANTGKFVGCAGI